MNQEGSSYFSELTLKEYKLATTSPLLFYMQSLIIWHTPPVNFLSLMSLTCTTLIARVVCIADSRGLPPEETVLGKIKIQM